MLQTEDYFYDNKGRIGFAVEINRDGDLEQDLIRRKQLQRKIFEERGLDFPMFNDQEVFSILV